MVLCDFHCHTAFSFDGAENSSADSLCRRALEIGLTDLCITDHCDVNGEAEGIYTHYDADKAWDAMTEAKEKYKGKLNLVRGIELGNATQYPDVADATLKAHPYEFIIGSLHNLNGVPDFASIRMETLTDRHISLLFDRAMDETAEMLSYRVPDGSQGITTLGHLTYIHRYVTKAGKKFDFKPHYDRIEHVYKLLMRQDIALELNVSTLWRGMGIGMPTLELLKFYHDCGGRLVTVGSDAHAPENLGRCIRQGYALLNAAGLHEVTVVRDGERVQASIE